MISNIVELNYDLKILNIKLLDSHFGTEIFKIDTDKGKYIVKTLPLHMTISENEGLITEYLYNNGIKVARQLKSRCGEYVVKTADVQLTVQDFIEGETFAVNTAPDWFMKKSAEALGRINLLLRDYGELPIKFDKDFFSVETAIHKKQHFENELAKAEKVGNQCIIPLWREQIRHLDRIASFNIDTSKLTYVNSHGDYHIGQAIARDNDITIIDWASACRLPVCLEVITSYVFASPSCHEGVIDADGLLNYICIYTKHFPLSQYDITAMPYILYFWHCVCNYSPDEFADIPQSYKAIAELISKLLDWLYDHVDELSKSI